MGVSEGHRQLTVEEYTALTEAHRDTWRDPALAAQQRELADAELARLHASEDVPVFNVLQDLVASLDQSPASILEVGCASGYYYEVLRLDGWRGRYLGVDYSEALIDLARSCHPGAKFCVADATDLGDIGAFDLVISGACLMHIPQWRIALAELVRVARGPVILHRTPIVLGGETSYWLKLAYGVPCLEIHFGEAEFLAAIQESGMRVVEYIDVGDAGMFMGRSYLCRKG
jgi:SAM-dependent methyltransferase